MSELPDALDVLRKTPLLADIGDSSLTSIVAYFDVMEGRAGDRLYAQGDTSIGLYVVAAGSVWAKVRDIDGDERRVRRLEAPESFGELSLLLRGERLVTIEAASDVVLLELSWENFRHLKGANPDLCLLLIMAIVRQFGRVLDDSREILQRLLLRQFAGLDAE